MWTWPSVRATSVRRRRQTQGTCYLRRVTLEVQRVVRVRDSLPGPRCTDVGRSRLGGLRSSRGPPSPGRAVSAGSTRSFRHTGPSCPPGRAWYGNHVMFWYKTKERLPKAPGQSCPNYLRASKGDCRRRRPEFGRPGTWRGSCSRRLRLYFSVVRPADLGETEVRRRGKHFYVSLSLPCFFMF